jgi:hypothetical protein
MHLPVNEAVECSTYGMTVHNGNSESYANGSGFAAIKKGAEK